MSTPTLIICSTLAVFAGFLLHQSAETLLNTVLTLLPFAIQTTR